MDVVNSFDAVHAVQIAALFVWLGMVLAISFLEAPLRFRAPGVSTVLGLGIGRTVFAALNVAEALLAIVLVICVIGTGLTQSAAVVLGLLVAVFVLQVAGVRPTLRRRTDRVLAGEDRPRCSAHHAYIGLEFAKVGLLLALGVLLLSGSAH
jgi:hypothetical protein